MLSRDRTRPLQPIVEDVWREKYRHGDERSYEDTCARVAGALCAREPDDFRDEALRAMIAREVVPAGRILAGAGTDKRVTLINCFVAPDIQDSMATHPDRPGLGIMDSLSVAAYTLQMGGGVGMDFSTIRPRGAVVKRTASVSSGVLPFMDMWHYMSETIMSAGHRRGAMMATLRCDHPDIEEFIAAKQRPGRLTNFNVSVLVTDAFMDAVAQDAGWHLIFDVPKAASISGSVPQVDDRGAFKHDGSKSAGYIYRVVRARELWDKIVGSTYVHAEPGVVFIDRINAQNNLDYCEDIHCVNPCGEQALPADGICNLGHTNLAVMVRDPFTAQAKFDFGCLVRSARTMVRLLDNVLDVTEFPTKPQAAEARGKRRVGLGFTGLASALQQLGIPYGSLEAVTFAGIVARAQATAAYEESAVLAEGRGAFPLFEVDKFLAAPFVQKIAGPQLREMIARTGIRNGVLLSVAPTGTTSIVLGNVSSGIEPVFAHSYRRKVRGGSGEMEREYAVYDYGYLRYCEDHGLDPETVAGSALPSYFTTTDQLDVEQHLQMAAAVQEWVDSAISKTINCPQSMALEEFKQVYSRAYALGLKGCTTYRPDPRSGRGAVLSTTSSEKEVRSSGEEAKRHEEGHEEGRQGRQGQVVPREPRADKVPMQEVVDARRYRIRWPHEDCAYYVVITDYVDGAGRRRPFELFISTKSTRHDEWIKAFSLMVTAIFRREGDPRFVVDELRSVFSATGGAWMGLPGVEGRRYVPSLVAAIGAKIEEHMRWLGMFPSEEPVVVETPGPASAPPAAELLDSCARCGARAVVYEEGCATCRACGHSDCG